jgi:hypothetical protein
MDPILQLQLMQQMGAGQFPGIPGMQAPLTLGGGGGSGIDVLMMYARPGGPYARPIAESTMPDISPLAPIQPFLQKFGVIGMLGGVAGNAHLTKMMQQNGVMPMGNAGSYMQAYRTREFQQMQQMVSSQVAGQDAESFYRTIRGGAAMAGMPMNQQQREAARSFANTFAEYGGPLLANAAPEVLDMFAGEKGSVQAMAAQMMQANRYRIDPLTGQMGYGTEANADLVNRTFETLFAEDNMGRMAGMRAGDIGQLYRELAPAGLTSPRGSLKDRTLMQLNAARDAGQLEAIGTEAGVDVSGNLSALSNEDLSKLRQTDPVRSRLSSADSRQISDQLQDYVATLKAMREVLGENGNPNAPIPLLINALKALTSGQMHKFDAAQLNTMVRDIQALSQMSGKSIDQMLAMNKTAAEEGKRYGIGTTFAPTATNVGVLTGMAFQERGGATGFGALNREESEQAAMNYFNRGMASEMSNSLGALGRIEESGGFADNNAGRRLAAVMEAARAGEQSYIDPVTGKERALPTKEAEFRAFIDAGAVDGMNRSSFNQMLGDRTSNLRYLSSDTDLQQAAFNNQSQDINKQITKQISNRLSSEAPLMAAGLDNKGRNQAARAMGTAANAALADLSAADIQNPEKRNRAIADALMVEASNQGVPLSDREALTMAAGVFGQAENGARRFGFESYTAFSQVIGQDVSETRSERTAQARARSGVNEAMSNLGPSGGIMQRLITAMQKQGDRGGEANIDSMLGDIFGTDLDMARDSLMPELQAVADEKANIDRLTAEIEGATPERRQELQREINTRTKELSARVDATRGIGKELGIGGGEGTFDREDVARSAAASRNLEHFNRNDQVRLLAASGRVTDSERAAVSKAQLSRKDFEALGVVERQKMLAEADVLSAGDIENLPPKIKDLYEEMKGRGVSEGAARKRIKQVMRDQVGTAEEYAADLADLYGDTKVGELDESDQDAIVRSRRSKMQLAPTDAEITKRMKELSGTVKISDGTDMPTAENLEELRTQLKEATPNEARAKKLGFESYEAYAQSKGIDTSPERQAALREEIKTKETARRDFTQLAEEQLLAENQLRALGQLEKGQTLMTKASELGSMDEELRLDLSKVPADDQAKKAEIVSRYLDNQTMQKFYGSEKEIEVNRVAAINQLKTDEGRKSVQDTETNIATMLDTRREFLLDEGAATRLGAARAVRAVERSREAEQGMQELANRYFDGNVGAMITTQGLGISATNAAKAEADFEKLSEDTPENEEKKKAIAARLSEQSGTTVSVSDLTASDYKAYIGLQGRDYVEEFTAANLEMSGAADNSLLAEELGVTQTELTALQKMATLSTTDVSADAKKLGMTEDEYRDVMQGGKLDESLRLFRGDDVDKQLREAKSDETTRSEVQVQLQRIQAERATEAGEDSALLAQEELRLTELLQPVENRRNERMKAVGLDPNKKEDVEIYKQRLENQGSLNQLEARREEYMTQRQELKDQGMDDKEIDTKLGTMEAEDAEAQKLMKEFRELDLSRSDLALAEGFGIDTTKSSPELTKFKQSLGGQDANDMRTQAMVAGVLGKVERLELGGADATAIEKLDMLTDQYAAASTDDRKKLAHAHGMDIKDLDRMMSQTSFMGLENVDMSEMGDEERQELLSDSLKRMRGRDVESEVAKEEERQMKLTGTVNITGVVEGEATFQDVTGSRRG